MNDDLTMRKVPQQKRSKERVDHILSVAETLFAQFGYDSVTTNQIAERAGVSVGSLYQFFPNKDALKEALINRYLEEMRQDKFSLNTNQPISRIVREMVGSTFAFSQRHAGFHNLFLSQFASARLHEQVMEGIYGMLGKVYPEMSETGRFQCAFMGVAIVKGIIAMSSDRPDIAQETLLDEIVRALLAYLRAVLLLEGISIPRDIA